MQLQVGAGADTRWCTCCSLNHRAALLRVGLQDADPKVQAAATNLLGAWHSEADGDILGLLRELDVDEHTGV